MNASITGASGSAQLVARLVTSLVAVVALSACIVDPPAAVDVEEVDTGQDAGRDVSIASDSGGDTSSDAGDSGVDADSGDPFVPHTFRRSSAGLALYYRFRDDEAGMIVDEGPEGLDAPLPNGAVLSPEGLDLSTSSFFSVPSGQLLISRLQGSPGFTVEMWVTTSDDVYSELVTFGGLRPAQVPAMNQSIDAPVCIINCATAPPQIAKALKRNAPTHLVITGHEQTLRVYIDGVLAASWLVEDVRSLLTSPATEDPKIELGSFSVARTYGLFAAYNRALSPGEVLSHSMVGPRPSPSDEVSVPLQALFPTYSDDGLFGLEATRRTLVDQADGTSRTVVASQSQNGLYLQELDLPDSGIFLDAALDFRSLRNQVANPGMLSAWVMERPWMNNATWESTGSEPWAAPGATSPADRGDEPFVDYSVETNGRVFGSAPIGAWMESVYEGRRTNAGFQFTCDGCAIEIDSESSSPHDFNRLRIKGLFEEARGSANLLQPTNIGLDPVAGRTYLMEWSGDSDGYEIFVGGRLVRQVWGANQAEVTVPDRGEATPVVQIRSVDRWGRYSAPVEVVAPAQ